MIGEHAVTVSPNGTKVVDLQELQAAGSAGGVNISYDGPEGGIVVNGGLEDQSTGYSAGIHFARALAPDAGTAKRTYAELGLMAGAADPMMSFPPDTVFTPYTVLRNIEENAISVTPTLYWMEGGGSRSATLPALTLPSHQTQTIDVMGLLAVAGLKSYNGMVNLILQTENKAGGLLVAAGSVDQKNTYVFEVTARPIAASASKGMSYWNTADGNDTMVTLWNPADEAQDLSFTLFFSGGHYALPVHLGPRATYTFNVSSIINSQIPDVDGNIIPASVHDGSAMISGTQGENEVILIAMDAGTYNVRKATCGGQCITCNGETSGAVLDNPFGVGVGGNHQLGFIMTWNTGQHYDYGSSSTWTSNHTNLATVSTGMVHGVSPGAVSITAIANEVPHYAIVCSPQNFPPPECPLTDLSGNDPGTVTPTITGIAPLSGVQGTTVPLVVISGSGFGSAPQVTVDSDIGVSGTTLNLGVAVEKLDLSENRPKRSDQKCIGDRRRSFIGHPDATHFRQKFCERVFQQPRAISTLSLQLREMRPSAYTLSRFTTQQRAKLATALRPIAPMPRPRSPSRPRR